MPTAIIRPGAPGFYQQMSVVGGTHTFATDPGPALAHDEDVSYVGTVAGVNTFIETFVPLASSIPVLIERINRIDSMFRSNRVNDGGSGPSALVFRGYVRLGGVDVTEPAYQSATAGAGYNTYTFGNVSRPGGGAWSPNDLVSLEFGVQQNIADGATTRHTSVWLLVDYKASGNAVESFREVGSRRLRLRRLPSGLIEADLPTLEYLDHELLDLMAISHPGLPSSDGRGAGLKPWERWPVLKLRSDVNWETGTERVLLRDMRTYLVRHWDIAKSLRISPKDTAAVEGVARMSVGATRTWVRPSNAWVYRADLRIIVVTNDGEKHDIDGDLFESASTNEIIQSAFKNGTFTGWTNAGTGSNGSAIAADTTDLLFASVTDGSAQSVKFTAGNPIHVADLQATATVTASVPANTVCRLAIWHKDDSGFPTSYAVQRAIDSKWWRDSDSTWQVAKTWNALPVSPIRARHGSKRMDVGTSATTITVVVGIPTTGQAGQVNHLYHVQFEKKPYSTSAIVTEAAVVTRAADQLLISNNANTRAWPPESAITARCKVRPWWDTADLPAGAKMTLFYAQHDANNYDWLYYDQASAAFKLERKAAGVTYTATKAIALSAFTLYNVAARITTSAGELGLAAYTLSVFAWADGVSGAGSKGTDAAAAALVPVNTANLEIASQAAAANFDGNVWWQEVTQQALGDAAVARF